MAFAIVSNLVGAAVSLWIAHKTGHSFPLIPASICIGTACGAMIFDRYLYAHG